MHKIPHHMHQVACVLLEGIELVTEKVGIEIVLQVFHQIDCNLFEHRLRQLHVVRENVAQDLDRGVLVKAMPVFLECNKAALLLNCHVLEPLEDSLHGWNDR